MRRSICESVHFVSEKKRSLKETFLDYILGPNYWFQVFPTWKSGASMPARRSRRSMRGKVVNCIYFMSVVHVILRTQNVYLYKSVKSSSCEGRVVCVKYESLEQTTSCWVGQDKQAGHKISMSKRRAQSDPRTRPGWTHSRGAARNSRWSMYKCR